MFTVAFMYLDRVFAFLAGTEFILGLLWTGLAALSIALFILAHTRWGQSRPLRKCFILSLLAHVLFACYATTVQIVASRPASPGETVMQVRIGADEDQQDPDLRENSDSEEKIDPKPWEQFAHETVAGPKTPPPDPLESPWEDRASGGEKTKTSRSHPKEKPALADTAGFDRLPLAAAELSNADPAAAELPPLDKAAPREAEPIKVPAPQRREAPDAAIAAMSDDVPQKPSTSSLASTMAERSAKIGVSTSLLDRPSPLPLLTQALLSPETAAAIASSLDAPTKATHGNPAAAVIDESGKIEMPAPQGNAALQATAAAAQNKSSADASSHPLAGLGLEAADSSTEKRAGAFMPVHNVVGPPHIDRRSADAENKPLPRIYSMRVAPDRSRLALENGATAETEAAVRAALKWLAENQNPDGRWECARHGGGQEMRVAGHDRLGAGIRADSAVTGLAILAFLASGNTHKEGEYAENVRRGLEFHLAVQRSDGSLAGQATHFAAMYCHAMAAFALSEAYAMTRDERLEEPVRRAVAYTLSAQDPRGGGWRYVPCDPGDTSQFGWQLMSLKSAELAGIPLSAETRRLMSRFLESVSSGRNGGLASYRPGQAPSRSMTAEALVCRQFLGMPPASAAGLEAGDYVIGQLPGEGTPNYYYWYYATIGMYQLQGDHWRRWNEALCSTLVESQRSSGPLAGSWDANSVWGCYGGRVYTTALGTLCLEVYYRYLPMYVEAASAARKVR